MINDLSLAFFGAIFLMYILCGFAVGSSYLWTNLNMGTSQDSKLSSALFPLVVAVKSVMAGLFWPIHLLVISRG